MASGWSLDAEARARALRGVGDALGAIAFHSGRGSAAAVRAEAQAAALEEKAHAFAAVAATTTTGDRPHAEGVRVYARKLAELALAAVAGAGEEAVGGGEAAAAAEAGVFSLRGEREFVTGPQARDLLAPLLADGAAFHKVCLSTKSFGPDAARVAAEAFAKLGAQLTDADLSDVIAGRPEDEALQALGIMCAGFAPGTLRAVDLSDNALGEKGVRACALALTAQTNLDSISFQNVGCSKQACEAIVELLPAPGTLKRFQLYNNMSGDAGAEAIAQLLRKTPNMEDFRMSVSRVSRAGGVALADALATGSKLVKLDLTDNGLMDDTGVALARALPSHAGLCTLLLNECSLGDKGVFAVAEALWRSAPKLQVLGLCCNDLTPAVAPALAQCLHAKSTLRSVALAENELGSKAVAHIAAGLAASANPLTSLNFDQTEIKRAGALALAQCAASKKGFVSLQINGNAFTQADIDDIQSVLQEGGLADDVLGSLEDNDEDGAEEEEDDELAGAMSGLSV